MVIEKRAVETDGVLIKHKAYIFQGIKPSMKSFRETNSNELGDYSHQSFVSSS